MLNPRLQACANYLQLGGVMCDVGTDHALLPVYAVEQGICTQAIAADIGAGPLAAAQRTISRSGLSDKIRTVLSDGLTRISKGMLTDVVIAGMGGETIIHILETCPWKLDGISLILQPMTKAAALRGWLYRNGFVIRRETCAHEEKFLYAVMQAEFTGNVQEPDAVVRRIGKMDLKDPACFSYAQRQLKTLCRSRDGRILAGHDPEPFASEAEALRKRLEERI